jgi:gamma-glutamyl:cysteine ligase YbdK (ATP-grasp superfamily)
MSRKRRLQAFRSRFRFNTHLKGYVGVERESFLVDRKSGLIVPRSPEVMATLVSITPQITYELSACQVESRHGPCKLTELKAQLLETDALLQRALKPFGLRAEYIPVAPKDIPLDIYPDPDGRYAHIAASISRETLAAACRAAGTHVHVGMRDHDDALEHHNEMCEQFDELVAAGNTSRGERIAAYGIVNPDWRPRPYGSWSSFYDDAARHGFEKNPRDNWKGSRMTAKGTLETRVFDTTDQVNLIVYWAEMCLNE